MSAHCVLVAVAVVVVVVGVWWVGSGSSMPHLWVWLFVVRSFLDRGPSRLVVCFVCRLPRAFGCDGAMLTFTESLILAQDERWRRA